MSVITYLSKAPDLILPVTRKTTSTKHLSSVKHTKKHTEFETNAKTGLTLA